jgi:UDP-N-acetylmuramoylalanine--D-glutamate ligase
MNSADLRPDDAAPVLVVGAGVTGLAAVRALVDLGRRVIISSDRPAPSEVADLGTAVTFAGDLTTVPGGVEQIVTSPGVRPDAPLLASARAAGVEVIGEVELAWRLDQGGAHPRDWLVVTGTNGKTTTVGLLESILRAAGRTVTACGNIGWPAVEAVRATPTQDDIAIELSSFQLHYAPGVRPRAGVVLNVAPDHLDWYGGSFGAYAADKALALVGEVAVAVVDDGPAAALLAASPAAMRVGVTVGPPTEGQLGVLDGILLDRAFGAGALLPAAEVRPSGAHNLTNALAAAALALAAGVDGPAVAAGLRSYEPSGHRNTPVATVGGVTYVDDSKATNPNAAEAALLAYPRVVWIAGGQLKGTSVDDLVIRIADRLAGVVLLGVDADVIAAAFDRHAPDVPRIAVPGRNDGAMDQAVRAASTLAQPGDVVLLAPAAASLDMFTSYAARGDAFCVAVAALRGREVGG